MATPQTFAISVPHASSQFALGRCACPDGASLTTVGSVLADAAGTLTVQSDGAFVAQTNAAMSWLSQSGTQVHTAAGLQIYAGGGVAPGACGAGSPASSPGKSKPGATTEKAVTVALAAASLLKGVLELKEAVGEAKEAAEAAAEAGKTLSAGEKALIAGGIVGTAVDAGKEGTEGTQEAAELLKKKKKEGEGEGEGEGEKKEGPEGKKKEEGPEGKKKEEGEEKESKLVPGLETAAGAIGTLTALASGDYAGALGKAAGLASGIAGLAGGADLEERAVNEIKMVAGTSITGSAAVGFEYKTLNKFSVTAGALTSFTTTAWSAFTLLKFEVKAIAAVKAKTRKVEVEASINAKMKAKAFLTFQSPTILYESKLKVTKTLTVLGDTKVHSLEVKKHSKLEGKLEVKGNVLIVKTLLVKKELKANDKLTVADATTAKDMATVSGDTKVA